MTIDSRFQLMEKIQMKNLFSRMLFSLERIQFKVTNLQFFFSNYFLNFNKGKQILINEKPKNNRMIC